MADAVRETPLERPLLVLLLLIAAGGAVDLVLDAPSNWLSPHVLYELFLIAAALGSAAWLWRRWRAAERDNARLEGLLPSGRRSATPGGPARSRRTVRQHAVAAYDKAGVAGRAELAAFFLTDLPLATSDQRTMR